MTYNTFKKQASSDPIEHSVNSLAALGTLAGTGLSAAGVTGGGYDVGALGGGILGGSLGAATGYHGAKILGYGQGVRLIAAALLATGGSIAGANLGRDCANSAPAYSGQTAITRGIERLTNGIREEGYLARHSAGAGQKR